MTRTAHHFPELVIVPLHSLRLHEHVNAGRMEPLAKTLVEQGVLKNPPAVLPLDDLTGEYVVLDGANRTRALHSLGLSYALVQVLDPARDEIKLNTWAQVIVGCSPTDLSREVRQIPGLRITPFTQSLENGESPTEGSLARLSLARGQQWRIDSKENGFEGRVLGLNTLIDTCARVGKIDRTSEYDANVIETLHPNLAGWLAVNQFTIEEVIALSKDGIRLPAGVTRFVLAPRALRVNFPLKYLSDPVSLLEAQKTLDEWFHYQVKGRNVRYYAEATYLFDE